jgi:hypothetical protein
MAIDSKINDTNRMVDRKVNQTDLDQVVKEIKFSMKTLDTIT